MEYMVEYQYLRPKKAQTLQQWHNKPFLCRDTLTVECYSKAVILPLRQFEGDSLSWGRGGMMDQKGHYIPASAMLTFYDYGYPVEECEYHDKKVVYCGFFTRHWGHFLLDALPRLWYFFEKDETIDKYVFLVNQDENTEILGNFRECFSLLGILDKIEVINQPVRYREVVVPELSYDRRRNYWSEKYNLILDTIADNVRPQLDWKPKERIFLSRSKLTKAVRMEAGMEVMDNFFQKNGYEILYPEKLSLSETIFMIRNAKICAAASGSAPHNLLFAHYGQKLVIMERYAYNDREQPDVNIIKRLNTVYVDANLSLYPVELSYGPFMFYYNRQFRQFAHDYGYEDPDEVYTDEKARKKLIKRYFAAYQDEHRYQWYMGEWMIPNTDSLYEAYQDSMEYFRDYMTGKRPFLWHHYLELHYFKQLVKCLLRKIRK